MQELSQNMSVAQKTLIASAWMPHPKAYIRRKTGTGGTHVNRIIKNKANSRVTASSAFQEYGIQAETMASTFDYQTMLQTKRQYYSHAQNTDRSELPQVIDGFKRNEAFAGIKPMNGPRNVATAAASGHRRTNTLDFGRENIGTAGTYAR